MDRKTIVLYRLIDELFNEIEELNKRIKRLEQQINKPQGTQEQKTQRTEQTRRETNQWRQLFKEIMNYLQTKKQVTLTDLFNNFANYPKNLIKEVVDWMEKHRLVTYSDDHRIIKINVVKEQRAQQQVEPEKRASKIKKAFGIEDNNQGNPKEENQNKEQR